jgi:magnesium transporter
MSSVSNKTNEVMRVLAIVSTIFSPLTFIAGTRINFLLIV